MTVNICLCGASAGYPHDEACPWPQFRETPDELARWLAAREEWLRLHVIPCGYCGRVLTHRGSPLSADGADVELFDHQHANLDGRRPGGPTRRR